MNKRSIYRSVQHPITRSVALNPTQSVRNYVGNKLPEQLHGKPAGFQNKMLFHSSISDRHIPCVPMSLEQFGLMYGFFAVSKIQSGAQLFWEVSESLKGQKVDFSIGSEENELDCCMTHQGLKLEFVVNLYSLLQEDQKSHAIGGMTGNYLIVVSMLSANWNLSLFPIINTIFQSPIKNGTFVVPNCTRNTSEASLQNTVNSTPSLMSPENSTKCEEVKQKGVLEMFELAISSFYYEQIEQALETLLRLTYNSPDLNVILGEHGVLVPLAQFIVKHSHAETTVLQYALLLLTNIATVMKNLNRESIGSSIKAVSIVFLNVYNKDSYSCSEIKRLSCKALAAILALDKHQTPAVVNSLGTHMTDALKQCRQLNLHDNRIHEPIQQVLQHRQ